MWVRQKDDTKLPKWLKDNLKSECLCGDDIENYYNPNQEITARRCMNNKCPYVMAQKVDSMRDILSVKGVGERTAFKWITEKKLNSHFETIPLIFGEKPTISIYNLLRITFIKGVDEGWSEVANQCDTLDEVFTKYKGKYKDVLEKNKEEILYGATFFNIEEKIKLQFEAIITGNVMISGNIRGLVTRESFVHGINQMSKGLIRLNVVGKRKTDVIALIQEADTPNRGKAETALECGIPIMTPDEFTKFISQKLKDKMAERAKRS